MSSKISPPSVDVPSCCAGSLERSPTGTKFHFALNVSHLERSVAFYRVLFDRPPAKQHADYAKFELEQPPLVFSLVPNAPASSGALSHFGFPVCSTEDVDAVNRRLKAAGLTTTCQQGTVCGYARQDKVWVADPDHNHWEVYVVHEDVDPESVRSGYDGMAPASGSSRMAVSQMESLLVWEHRVMQPLPDRIPCEEGTVDEVRLEGTFNSAFTEEVRRGFLLEVRRALKPGGLVSVHGLVADQPVDGLPALPGVASLVKRVPVESEPLRELREAGFENLQITKLPESSAFQKGGIEMREIKIACRKAGTIQSASQRRIMIYKGPFAEAVDENGQVFPRGRRTEVSEAAWDRLGRSAAAKQFLFLGSETQDDAACGG